VKSQWTSSLHRVIVAAIAIFAFNIHVAGQKAQPIGGPSPGDDRSAFRDLQQEVHELRTLVEQMRDDNAESRSEMQQLREELQATRAMLEKSKNESVARNASNSTEPPQEKAATDASAAPQNQSSLNERVQKLEESTSLLGSKIDEQYQTKVETASKYRARLHGIVLMNAFRNVGGSDNLDLPTYAEPLPSAIPQATFSATLRQSEIGLEIFGPKVAGAKTSADVQLDFSGGFPITGNGVNFGIVRLQTANLRFDWEHTSVVAGQDSLFISPSTPTSFASLAIPTFAFAGNLWGWTPQIRLEHRFAISDQQTLMVQGGILDNLDWEYPYNSFYRTPQAGELSGQPAYALRTSWTRSINEHPLSVGLAGYYGRQNWLWDRNVDAWAGMADWQIPILPHLGLSGEFYRGKAIGGLGAAVGVSILYGGDPTKPFTPIRGFDSAGGWAQLKWQLTPKLELNGAIAEDDGFASDVRGFATDQNNFGPIIGRNRGALGNVVFRPRSDLILSAELKRLRSFPVYSSSSVLNQVSVSAGILF
jgi:Skp family chaperone for outer membrane proteins